MNRYEYICRIDDLGVTVVENTFINHYLPEAPGNYVKIYLYALKLVASSGSAEMNDSRLAKALNMTEQDVIDAWEYWEREGVITTEGTGDSKVIRFENLASIVFGGKKITPKETPSISRVNESMLMEIEGKMKRLLTHNEKDIILSWNDDYNIATQAIVLLIEDCINRGKTSINYWDTVAKGFFDSGVSTYDQALDYFEFRDERYSQYKEIMKYLGLMHNATEPEKKLMNKWLDEYNLDIETIKLAADDTVGANRPSLKYLDSIIEGKMNGDTPKTTRKSGVALKTTGTEMNYNYDDLEKFLVMDFDKYDDEDEEDDE